MTLYTFADSSNYSVDADGIIVKPTFDDGRYKVVGFAEVAEYKAGMPMVRNSPLFDKNGRKNPHLMDRPKQGSRLVAMTVDADGKHVGVLTEDNTKISLPIRSFR